MRRSAEEIEAVLRERGLSLTPQRRAIVRCLALQGGHWTAAEVLAAYQARCIDLRERSQPTLPTSIAQELLINPFLRTRQSALVSSAKRFDAAAHDDTSVFAAIRQWKNEFK